MTFTEVFGGTTIYPSGVSYRAVALSADQTLSWPVETATSGNVVAQIMDVTPSAGSLSIIMPPANEVSVGETTLFFNPGGFTFTVKDNGGNTIVAIAPGLSYQVYLIGNATVNGTWRSTQYAAGTSSATAGSLVGAGIKAINTTLNQSMSVTTLNSNYSIGDADRSEAFVWTGGAGALTLPASGTVGNDWFCHIRNGGTGAITLTPTGSELINGAPNLTFNPGDSAIVICDGASFFTIGFGQSVAFAFDYVSIDLSSPVTSPYTLSGANLNRIAYSFGGTLTANMQVLIPATIQQYWISNDTSGAFSLTVKVAGQIGVVIPQGSRGIYYCNGTDIIDADTASFAFPLTVAQGGTGATTESGARINLGGTSVGIGVFTAVTAADGRNALSAAKSGANSDITSLSGLTTPLSVGQGGTGAATLTANGVVVGNGTSAVQVTAAGTTGQVLVGNTGGAPSWATLTGIGVTSFSGGTTGLTPASPTTGAITLAGTLGVANGGTGTATVFTAGSVVFAGASGVYSQDNANFFWDDTNNRLGIGTAAPANRLQVSYTSTTPSLSSDAGSGLSLLGSSTLRVNIGSDPSSPFGGWIQASNGSGSSFPLTLNPLGGNVGIGTASPSTVYRQTINGDGSSIVGGLSLRNNGTETLAIGNITAANDVDSEIWNPRNGFLRFATNNSERMRVTSAGNVGIGTSLPGNRLHVYETASQTVARFESTLGSAFISLHTGSAQTFLGSDSTGAFLVQTPGSGYSTKMLVDASGNVLVGTTTANGILSVVGDQISIGAGSGSGSLGIQIKGATLSAIPAAQTQGYIATGGSGMGVAGDLLIASRTDAAANIRFITGTTPAERMRIASGGNVGIGTTSPAAPLEVSSTTDEILRITSTGSPYASWYTGATRRGYIQAQAGSFTVSSDVGLPLLFSTNVTERMRITDTGLVGIGTTTPGYKLEVRTDGASDFNWITSFNNTAVGGYGAGFIARSGTNFGYFYMRGDGLAFVENAGNNGLCFATNGFERMRVTGAGDVGIGTTAPISKFEVTSGYITSGTVSSTGGAKILAGQWSGTEHLTTFGSEYSSGGPALGYAVWPSTTTFGSFVSATSVSQPRTAYVLSGNDHVWYTGATQTVAVGSPVTMTETMRINSAGNVGIGTASPTLKLEVNGSIAVLGVGSAVTFDTTGAAQANYISTVNDFNIRMYCGRGLTSGFTAASDSARIETNATERMRITSGGDVGINTSSPASGLDVNSIAIWCGTKTASSGSGGNVRFRDDTGTFRYAIGILGSPAATAFSIYDNVAANDRLTITSTGNVGIGTVSPNSLLQSSYGVPASVPAAGTGGHGLAVGSSGYGLTAGALTSGNAYLQATRWDGTATNYNLLLQPNGGDVGIGTTSPVTRLEVVGNQRITKTGLGYEASMLSFSTPSETAAIYRMGMATGGNFAIGRSDTATTNITLDSSGNVGIGTSSPTSKLFVEGTIQARSGATGVLIYGDGSGAGYIQSAAASNPLIFQIGIVERARIDGSGNLLVGTTTFSVTPTRAEISAPADAYGLLASTETDAYAALLAYNKSTTGNNVFVAFGTEAAFTSRGTINYNRGAGQVSYNTTSDYRAKDILGPVENSGATIDALKVHTGKMHGAIIARPMLIAHEAQEVVPYAVSGEKDAVNEDGSPDYQQVDHQVLIPLLIAEIQSLRARVAQLEGK